jgi:hypothetical protein
VWVGLSACVGRSVGDDEAIVEEFDFGGVGEGDVFVEGVPLSTIVLNGAILW